MEILANGAAREVPSGITLAGFLDSLDLPTARVAVERNGAIVPADRYEAVILPGGDELEVVTLVGGG